MQLYPAPVKTLSDATVACDNSYYVVQIYKHFGFLLASQLLTYSTKKIMTLIFCTISMALVKHSQCNQLSCSTIDIFNSAFIFSMDDNRQLSSSFSLSFPESTGLSFYAGLQLLGNHCHSLILLVAIPSSLQGIIVCSTSTSVCTGNDVEYTVGSGNTRLVTLHGGRHSVIVTQFVYISAQLGSANPKILR